MSLNKVMLIGHLGSDPELRYTQGGQPVANFNLATNERWADKSGQMQERTEWHKIVVWGKIAETCEKYLKKGRQAYIEGRIQTRDWEDKDGGMLSLYPLIGGQKDIAPLEGRMVFFRSDEMEHEVHPSTTRERKSIAGWLKD